MKRTRRWISLAVAAVGAPLVAACGTAAAGAAPSTAPPTGATVSVAPLALPSGTAALPDSLYPKDSGTYVFSGDGLSISFQLPAQPQDPLVQQFRAFARLTRSARLHVAAVTVQNGSRELVNLNRFSVLGPPVGRVGFAPLDDYLLQGLATLNITLDAAAYQAGSLLMLALPQDVSPGQTVTSLVATNQPLTQISSVVYTPPNGPPITLQATWVLKEQAKAAARHLAAVAAALAREQAALARQQERAAAAQARQLAREEAAARLQAREAAAARRHRTPTPTPSPTA